MILRKAERKRAKIKLAIQGPAGSGKTYSSILLAKGLANSDMSKVAVIDTESGSADLYAHLGDYNVITLQAPHNPEKYLEAIDVCLNAGMEVIILDSISHAWDFLLDYHSSLPGNSFSNWSKVTPLQNAFIDKILNSDAHFIASLRTKQDYVLNLKDGKYIPEKVGLKAIQRDNVDYEFTIVFDIDIKNFVVASKDRTNLFFGRPEFKITEETGLKILDWCNRGSDSSNASKEIISKINKSLTLEELEKIYFDYPEYQNSLKTLFIFKKKQLSELVNPQNFSKNGSSKSR